MGNEAWDCMLDTDIKGDYILSGHKYIALFQLSDLDTGRYYGVLQCKRCKHFSVGFAEKELDGQGVLIEVGGE